MLIDLNSAQQGEWFYFFSSHIDQATGEIIYDEPVQDARVKVRGIGPFVEERLSKRKKEVEHVFNPKTRSMERIEYYPELSPAEQKAERDDLWDYAITGIENFKDSGTGEIIGCTREAKLALMQLPVFDRFIARCLQLLSSSGAKEGDEKNL